MLHMLLHAYAHGHLRQMRIQMMHAHWLMHRATHCPAIFGKNSICRSNHQHGNGRMQCMHAGSLTVHASPVSGRQYRSTRCCKHGWET